MQLTFFLTLICMGVFACVFSAERSLRRRARRRVERPLGCPRLTRIRPLPSPPLPSPRYERVRRKHFELFYYSHHIFLLLVPAVLLHAASAWMFVALGAVLWAVDRMVRLGNASGAVHLLDVKAHLEHTSLKLVVEDGSRCPFAFLFSRISFACSGSGEGCGPIAHGAGQYCFLNIPQVRAPFCAVPFDPFDSVVRHPVERDPTAETVRFCCRRSSRSNASSVHPSHLPFPLARRSLFSSGTPSPSPLRRTTRTVRSTSRRMATSPRRCTRT